MRSRATQGPLLERARAWFAAAVLFRDRSEQDQRAFERYARATTVRLTELFCLALSVPLAGYLLVDWVALGPGPALAASVRWRLVVAGFFALAIVLARLMRSTGRDALAYPLGIAGGTAMCGLIGATTASTAPLGSVTTAAYLLLPLFTVPVLGGLRVRLVATLLPAAAVIVGFVWRNPAQLRAPGFAYFLSVHAFACALSIGTGHTLSYVVRRGFLLSRELRALAASLEERVRERTRELRALSEQLAEAREQERRRLARDLHDEFGQLLSATALAVDRARTQPAPAVREEELARARALLGEAMSAARGMLAQLHPKALEESGFEGAFALLLDQLERDTGAACVWAIELDAGALPAPHAEALFRVLQESLRNVRRHARARRVDVLLHERDGAARLEVVDDGVGFDVAERRPGSFGLFGMRERVEALGGRFSLATAPGAGTRVAVELPLRAAEAPR